MGTLWKGNQGNIHIWVLDWTAANGAVHGELFEERHIYTASPLSRWSQCMIPSNALLCMYSRPRTPIFVVVRRG